MEYKKWQKKSQRQFNEILALQQQISKKEGELFGTKNETSNLHHQLKQQHDMLSVTPADRQTVQNTLADKSQEGTEMYKDEAKNSMRQRNVVQLSMIQEHADDEAEEVKSNQQTKVRDRALAVQNKEKHNSLISSNVEIKILEKEGMKKWERFVTGSSELTQRHNHNLQIIQKNCEEVSYQGFLNIL